MHPASGSGSADAEPVRPSPRGRHSLGDILPAARESRAGAWAKPGPSCPPGTVIIHCHPHAAIERDTLRASHGARPPRIPRPPRAPALGEQRASRAVSGDLGSEKNRLVSRPAHGPCLPHGADSRTRPSALPETLRSRRLSSPIAPTANESAEKPSDLLKVARQGHGKLSPRAVLLPAGWGSPGPGRTVRAALTELRVTLSLSALVPCWVLSSHCLSRLVVTEINMVPDWR